MRHIIWGFFSMMCLIFLGGFYCEKDEKSVLVSKFDANTVVKYKYRLFHKNLTLKITYWFVIFVISPLPYSANKCLKNI